MGTVTHRSKVTEAQRYKEAILQMLFVTFLLSFITGFGFFGMYYWLLGGTDRAVDATMLFLCLLLFLVLWRMTYTFVADQYNMLVKRDEEEAQPPPPRRRYLDHNKIPLDRMNE